MDLSALTAADPSGPLLRSAALTFKQVHVQVQVHLAYVDRKRKAKAPSNVRAPGMNAVVCCFF